VSRGGAAIIGAAESPYTRHAPLEWQGQELRTEHLLADATVRALEDAGIERDQVDGLGVCSFTLAPDHAIDIAWRLGMSLRWLMEDTSGGAGGINMLQHAVRAVEAGDASVIVLVAGDKIFGRDYETLNDNYNRATRDYLAVLPMEGPNTLFSFITQRHMRRYGLGREDYACVALAQRRWATRNPGAVYRRPLTLEEYLAAPVVAPPLHRYDCVPPVAGADAIVVAAVDRGADTRAARVRAVGTAYDHDKQEGDGLSTGLSVCAGPTWERAGLGPEDADVVSVYDDYPVMVVIQAAELGLIPDGDPARFLHADLWEGQLPLNTSGGQLSAGQAGAGAGLHGVVEVVTQLRGRAGQRQVESARIGVSTGYGMVLWRHGACANVAVLERID
jgi:acetyl-CoA acetyltransferase